MKDTFKLLKKFYDYEIHSIKDQGVHFVAHTITGNIMGNCRVNEVSTTLVSLAEQCTEGVQFNWASYLCKEILMDCKEA